MSIKNNNRFAWGLVLIVVGCLALVNKLHILPPFWESIIFNFKNYPLIIGIIFLLFHSKKTIGIVLISIAVLFRLSDIINLTKNVSDYIWPTLLVIAGAIIILGNRKK